jgi:hypothetical protein
MNHDDWDACFGTDYSACGPGPCCWFVGYGLGMFTAGYPSRPGKGGLTCLPSLHKHEAWDAPRLDLTVPQPWSGAVGTLKLILT